MKVNRRTVPLDMISLEKGNLSILISTHYQELVFDARNRKLCKTHKKRMSFDALYKWIKENAE